VLFVDLDNFNDLRATSTGIYSSRSPIAWVQLVCAPRTPPSMLLAEMSSWYLLEDAVEVAVSVSERIASVCELLSRRQEVFTRGQHRNS